LINYGHVLAIATSEQSPMMKADIVGCDKQDDRGPAHLFSSAVIKQVEATQPKSVGLAVFLYMVGGVIDAQQNRFITHQEQLVMLYRGCFFFEGWQEYILSHGMYSTQTHFISPELYDILMIFINSMITLILVYCDYYPQYPLLPWLHSTEPLKHFYGCA
jgi:hypothetical protein